MLGFWVHTHAHATAHSHGFAHTHAHTLLTARSHRTLCVTFMYLQDQISCLMRDTGAMAFRLNKPLTVRLFPVPGGNAGDMTTFTSADLCNCSIFAVP